MDVIMNKVPPQALEMEESILASCMLFPDQAIDVFDALKPGEFYRTAHERIFTAMIDLHRSKKNTDLFALVNELRDRGDLEDVGGATYLSRLIEVPVPPSVDEYVEIIKNKYTLRMLIEQANNIIGNCFDSSGSVGKILNDAQVAIIAIEYGEKSTESASMNDLLMKGIERYEEIQMSDKGIGIKSGYIDLDEILYGFQDTDLIVLAGRPSMGKTAFMLNMAGKQADEGIGVGIFSLEQSNYQIIDRIVSSESGVESTKFKSGKFSMEDWDALVKSADRIHKWPIRFDDKAGLHYLEIARRARRMVKKHNVQIIYVDYLGFVKGDHPDNRVQDIGSITRGLKQLAKELKLPIVLLAQLNRRLEERPSKKPRLSDLRDSGDIEQDADVVIFLYRDELYNPTEDDSTKGIVEIIIAKHRNGPRGIAELVFMEKQMRFLNKSREIV